ncbi:MAG: T9SS type A sorting domain-containing protein [Bacteroidetes bacterium]|nr:T9SS type A sorting domain-containing protein [Fibrella sp.]
MKKNYLTESPQAVNFILFLLAVLYSPTLFAQAPYLVKKINSVAKGDSSQVTVAGSLLYFMANDGLTGYELWRSDGTEAGTLRVKDVNPGPKSSLPKILASIGNVLYFTANDGLSGSELWKTDGTEVGTVQVKDINPGGSGSAPLSYYQSPIVANNVLYFQAYTGTTGTELWRSDGTSTGTVLVKDINPGNANSSPQNLATVGGTVYFQATDPVHGSELWKSDGTKAGTVLVKDIEPNRNGSFPLTLTVLNSTIFFLATTSRNGNELWRSDGTEAGTVLVKDIVPGAGNAWPRAFAPMGNRLYFAATSGNQVGLWKSDGTEAGTELVFVSHRYSVVELPIIIPLIVQAVDNTLYFTADQNRDFENEIYQSDGTTSGTKPSLAISTVPEELYEVDNVTPWGLERQTLFGPVKRLRIASVNNTLYFQSDSAKTGAELWKSTNGLATTEQVADLNPGRSNASPDLLKVVGNRLFFIADDGVNDRQLWAVNLSNGPSPLSLTAPAYNCASGAFTFNTAGGDGSPVSFSAIGITGPTTNPDQFVDQALRIAADAPLITLSATQRGVTATYSWNIRAVCPLAPGNGPLTLTAPTYSCITGAFTFNTSGGDGSLIEYRAVPGITGWTSNPNQFVDAESRTANDVRPFRLEARQNGVVVTLTWDLKATCGRARQETAESPDDTKVAVLGNPVQGQTVEIEISGASGKRVHLELIDLQGRVLHQHSLDATSSPERVSLPLGGQGVFLLRVNTPNHRRQIKLIKP